MKYVMLRSRESGTVHPVFCLAPLAHIDLARAFASTHEPVSAGFCEVSNDGSIRTGGYSSSLNLKPAESDAFLIQAMIKATLALVPAI